MEQFIEFIGNHVILSTVWVALFAMLVFSFVNSALSPVKELSTQDATLMVNREDAVIIDIREAKEFKAGHILGARQLKPEQVNAQEFSSLEKYKDKPIIVVCAMGMTAKKAATNMLKKGFSRVSVLKGGMNAWQSAKLPVVKK